MLEVSIVTGNDDVDVVAEISSENLIWAEVRFDGGDFRLMISNHPWGPGHALVVEHLESALAVAKCRLRELYVPGEDFRSMSA